MRDNKVINDFGDEWNRFNFLDEIELLKLENQFKKYISPLPSNFLREGALVAADFGAGSGRWSHFLKEYCSKLYVVEPSEKAFKVCQRRFKETKIICLNQSVADNEVPESSLDLAISLGVLHHIPDTRLAIEQVGKKLKEGGVFLCYLYYALENKPRVYRLIWKMSDSIRKITSKLPKPLKFFLAEVLALLVYLPLAKISKLLEKQGKSVYKIPLHHYKDLSFKVMRNDALDRFGTSLEQRFTKDEITEMLDNSGFDIDSLKFSTDEPFWTFAVKKI
jgi:SAM-dependent methyltransferase